MGPAIGPVDESYFGQHGKGRNTPDDRRRDGRNHRWNSPSHPMSVLVLLVASVACFEKKLYFVSVVRLYAE